MAAAAAGAAAAWSTADDGESMAANTSFNQHTIPFPRLDLAYGIGRLDMHIFGPAVPDVVTWLLMDPHTHINAAHESHEDLRWNKVGDLATANMDIGGSLGIVPCLELLVSLS
mmetsp:Transcript_41630/g.89951  ORF Transcript_41630/g.89951 Transcript_41630/m.89951 type:complete len:113 (-) Transcript_41630:413-751(-)